MNSQTYYVYILACASRRLDVGVTNHLERRVAEHKAKLVEGFTGRYDINRLVYYDWFSDVRDALAAEKRINGWRRERKLARIQSRNPEWLDLAADWPTATVEQG
jgi:putative endonuclease